MKVTDYVMNIKNFMLQRCMPLESWKKLLYTLSIVASLLLIIDINLFDIPNIRDKTGVVSTRFTFWVCIYFLIDFFILFILSKQKMFFLRNYGILIFISIPYVPIFHFFDLPVPTQVLYLFKLLPLLRGLIALILLIRLMVANRITGLFFSYLALMITVFYFQTLIFYTFEAGVNKQVQSYGDVIWWASLTVTTLGSNIIPVTVMGKIATVILAVTGITVFPVFTVYITSMVQTIHSKKTKLSKNNQKQNNNSQSSSNQNNTNSKPNNVSQNNSNLK